MPRPVEAVVDLAAARHNLAVVRRAAPGAKVMAVMKADAYGHGLARLLPALATADGIAVLDLDAVHTVRAAGFGGTVLLLQGVWTADDLRAASALGASIVVHDPRHLELLARVPPVRPIDVWIKLNSGMNRLGFRPAAFRDACATLAAHPQVARRVAITHFASAETGEHVDAQCALFDAAVAGLALERSLANSAAVFAHPRTHADWVRPGIALYGATPFDDRSAAALGLRPVMTLRAEIFGTQTLAAGERVGYGGTFVAPHPMRIGIVACGYADGYPRHAPTGAPVAVAGRASRTLGRVSMDMLMVDLDGHDTASVGTAVELWGAAVPVDAVAAHAGTVGYELLTARAPRVPVRVVDAEA
ncbi:MAG: alanine racemase [Burkholderiales bacterium]|nr:alanine racemase [Burkholderiales bacterium]